MVGFNRRFAPFTERLKQFFAGRQEPMMVHVRVNAGYVPRDHWVQRNTSGGGRIIGELCHFVDWARCIVGASIVSVTANALQDRARYNRDNIVVTLAFEDGSIGNILYLANGDRSIPKEQFEVFCEGKVGQISDFDALELARDGKTKRIKAKRDKGHERGIELTVEAMRRGARSPIAFDEVVEISEATFAIDEAIATGNLVSLRATHTAAGEHAAALRSSEP